MGAYGAGDQWLAVADAAYIGCPIPDLILPGFDGLYRRQIMDGFIYATIYRKLGIMYQMIGASFS